MPLQNRVDPYGHLIATKARGTMMGNRGLLHNDKRQIVRNHRGIRWICCLLQFKGRRDDVMAPGQYTRLFFLDEATALAAGHRPCAECRRPAYNAFLGAWERVYGGRWSAPEMDQVLHQERLAGPYEASTDDLPDGCMVEWSGHPYLIRGHSLLLWTHFGYTELIQRPPASTSKVLTPGSIVKLLREDYVAGYGPRTLALPKF